MTGTHDRDRARLSREERLSAAILGFALLLPLVVACFLKPSPLNMGTHQQLGLPPCTVMVLFGHRCPACGMTTAWAHLVRGHVVGAIRANVGGAILGILDMVAVPWLLLSAARGRWLGWVPNLDVLAWAIAAVMFVAVFDWIVRLVAGAG